MDPDSNLLWLNWANQTTLNAYISTSYFQDGSKIWVGYKQPNYWNLGLTGCKIWILHKAA